MLMAQFDLLFLAQLFDFLQVKDKLSLRTTCKQFNKSFIHADKKDIVWKIDFSENDFEDLKFKSSNIDLNFDFKILHSKNFEKLHFKNNVYKLKLDMFFRSCDEKQKISDFTNLKILDVTKCIYRISLFDIAKLTKLEYLYYHNTDLTITYYDKEYITELSKLKNLKFLSLFISPRTNFEFLLNLPNLYSLDLYICPFVYDIDYILDNKYIKEFSKYGEVMILNIYTNKIVKNI